MFNRSSSSSEFQRAVRRVVDTERCTGCGLCAQLSPHLQMSLVDGYMRPTVVSAPGTPSEGASPSRAEFEGFCPGVRVRAVRSREVYRDPLFGPIAGVWEAWATDPETRFTGSSGGTLTALAAWLVESGQSHQVLSAGADPADRRRPVPVMITSRDEALAAAGSRYAPCSPAASPVSLDADGTVIAKPCDVSALRARTDQTQQPAPLLLSFFCAGTPSQHATNRLIEDLGVDDPESIENFWYRGRGWPGRFTVETSKGETVSTSYEDSWGKALGPTVQWRCRTCADGVGESSDITAGDFWRADERGYPSFEIRDGVSVLIARTPRGLDIVNQAVKAGVITVKPTDIRHLYPIQTYQVARRKYLWGRLLATYLEHNSVTRYEGFGLWRFTVKSPRRTWHEFRGTMSRLKARRTSHARQTQDRRRIRL